MNLYDKFVERVKGLEIEFRLIQDNVFDYDRDNPFSITSAFIKFFDSDQKDVLKGKLNELENLSAKAIKYIKISTDEVDYQKGMLYTKNLYESDFCQSNSFGQSDYAYLLEKFRLILERHLTAIEIQPQDELSLARETQTTHRYAFKETPFINETHYRAFLYLEQNSNISGKKKWTYIFNCLKDNYELSISEREYFSFVCDNYEQLSERPQPSANNQAIVEFMNELFERFATTL